MKTVIEFFSENSLGYPSKELFIENPPKYTLPKVGDTISINGNTFKVLTIFKDYSLTKIVITVLLR